MSGSVSAVLEAAPITKFEVARRQLSTAIDLWFEDKDAVSIHALAFAAYEILHRICKNHNNQTKLLFDSPIIREEYRGDFAKSLKRHASFFKHADTDANATIDFPSQITEIFFLFSIYAISAMGKERTDTELAWMWWWLIHNPNALTPLGVKMLPDSFSVEGINDAKRFGKGQFLKEFLTARKRLRVV